LAQAKGPGTHDFVCTTLRVAGPRPSRPSLRNDTSVTADR
jgi:hypothetical protein